jgi:hypothetical protein
MVGNAVARVTSRLPIESETHLLAHPDARNQVLGGGGILSKNTLAFRGEVDSVPFAESTGTISGPYSTTDTIFTVDPGDGATTFEAVFGAFVRGVAHVVFFVTGYNDTQGDSCAIQGRLQFKLVRPIMPGAGLAQAFAACASRSEFIRLEANYDSAAARR